MTEAERVAAEVELAWREHNQGSLSVAWRRSALLPVLAERQNWRCCYCGGRMDTQKGRPDSATVEHVIPKAKGGTDNPGNLVAACERCNSARGSTYRPEHREALAHVWKRPTVRPQETPDA